MILSQTLKTPLVAVKAPAGQCYKSDALVAQKTYGSADASSERRWGC